MARKKLRTNELDLPKRLFEPTPTLTFVLGHRVQENGSFGAGTRSRSCLFHKLGADDGIDHLSVTTFVIGKQIRRQFVASAVSRAGLKIDFDPYLLAQPWTLHTRGRYCTSRMPELYLGVSPSLI